MTDLRRCAAAVLAAALSAAVISAAAAPATDTPPAWASLTAAQQQALQPLQREWATMPQQSREKWLEMAGRLPRMPAEERARVQARMGEWARMTPAQRATARLQFQEARGVPAEERAARWQAYQSLPPDERSELRQKAKAAAKPPTLGASAGAYAATTPAANAGRRAPAAGASTAPSALASPASGKSTALLPPASVTPRPATSGLVQVKPGATTTPIGTRPTPPAHHQPGLPKIVASPGFVDPATLLPQRGPQGAAVRSAASSDPSRQP